VVNIPGFGYSRINTAYASGEGNKLPGGGPELARKTVEQFIGVPIQYFAQVDFNTFAQFVNRIGGVDIYNDEVLLLDRIGSGKDGETHLLRHAASRR
jgi:anionic cell wall polymer biosynthesis LytR-Cps2A-Psr (LCP) family protein